MAHKIISLLSKLRSAEDAVIEARFCALGQQPEMQRRRISPFRVTRFA